MFACDRGHFPSVAYDLPVVIPSYTHVQVLIDETRSRNSQNFHVSGWHPGIVQCVIDDCYYVTYTDILDDKVYHVYMKVIDASPEKHTAEI